jgi:PAS domain S-box-containing protein
MSGRSNASPDPKRWKRRAPDVETALAYDIPNAYFQSVFDGMFEGIQIIDFDYRYVYLNETAARHGRRAREELIGRKMVDMYPGIDQTEVFRLLQSCMVERTPKQMINQFVYPDGGSAWFDLRISPIAMGILILSVDISARKSAEEQLRQSQENLAATLECMAEGVVTTDVQGRVTRMNLVAETLTGWTEEEGRGRPLDELVRFLNQRTRQAVEHPVGRVLREGLRIGLANDTVIVTRNGSRVPIASSGAPIRDGGGNICGVVLILRDMKEEYELTAMLQQAQKMEAIGRLAGGVAHDFNNLLMVISGYSGMAVHRAAGDETLRDQLEQIGRAAERAASLTRQLLAFSRKQVLQPTVLNLNTVVDQMDKMLQRLIGSDVDLVTRLHPNLDLVKCDPGQIEQIVMNLAVNARDAMPTGGKLTIETANVELDEGYARAHAGSHFGPHVMIAVTDTGTGMNAEVKSRIFEPFFTTKELGKGTGLGLATVYGIVKQSGGNIWVYSELGHGTTFKIYLPRVEHRAGSVKRAVERKPGPKGTETILVVEDEEGVRGLLCTVLETGGYKVLATDDVEAALEICSEYEGKVHLLLTDVVLPKMGGPQLAEKIVSMRPDVKVVYMSGYTDDAIVHHGVLDPGTAFIEKPIAPNALLEKIREFLS